MFPYPSGKGLHVGHPLGYIATDTLARYRRMKGDNVLYTMGYDAFGLPAEQYAVQTGQHPAITTNQNIANMRRQLRRMGLSHDSRRSFATTDIEYVHWTQWIFLQVFNSWFDPQATAPDGSKGAARPINELIAKLESGEILPEDALTMPPWIAPPRRRSSTPTASLTSPRPCQLVPPASARSWPTRKLPRTGAPSAATTRSSSATCVSG